jgi:Family of unknown function (DUF5681)
MRLSAKPKRGRFAKRRHKLEHDEPAIASATHSSDGEYRVGPGHPPKEFQFKKGKSGNPRGARRKPPLIAPDLKALLEQALNDKVKRRRGEREQIATKLTAGIERLVDQFVNGDHRARRDLLPLLDKRGIGLAASRSERRQIDASSEAERRQALLDRGVPARLLPPIDSAGLEPPPDPPLPPDDEVES